jgi:hypothetical protein
MAGFIKKHSSFLIQFAVFPKDVQEKEHPLLKIIEDFVDIL